MATRAARILISILILSMLCSCAQKSTISIGELQVYDQPFDEWIHQEFKPEISDGYSEFTTGNYVALSAAAATAALDVISTQQALDRGGEEANPLMGSGSVGQVLLVKGLLFGLGYLAIEHGTDPENRQTARNWLWGLVSVAQGAAAAHNFSIGD